MSNQYRAWSESELDRLKSLRKQGLENEDIARTLGRSLTSVRSKVEWLTLSGQITTGRFLAAEDRWEERLARDCEKHRRAYMREYVRVFGGVAA
jgi:hypothetical protein